MKKERLVYSSSLAAIVSIALTVVLTILGELLPSLKDWLKSFSGHHWTTKSIFSLIAYAGFLLLFYVLPFPTSRGLRNVLYSLFIAIILGVVALLLFFTGHHWGVF